MLFLLFMSCQGIIFWPDISTYINVDIYLYIYIFFFFITVYMMPEIISPLFRARGRFVVPEESRHRSLEVSARKKMAPKAAKTIAPKAENNGRWWCFGQMIFLSEINLDMNSATLKLSLGREFC